MPRRKRRWWRWCVLAGAVGLLVVLVTAWLMFQHIPSWYRPVAIPPGELQRVRDDLTATYSRLNDSLVKEPAAFEQRFTQDQINAWLSAREEIDPTSRRWLPEALSDPFVMIDSDGVRLAATYRLGGLRTVLSARLQLAVVADGIEVRLVNVSGGSLSAPKAWVRDELAALDGGVWPAGERSRSQFGGERLPRLSGLFEGVVFPAAWIWENGEQPFRIKDLRFEPGAVAITLEPLDRHGPRRRNSQRSPD